MPAVSRCLNAGGQGRQDWETETLIPTTGGGFDDRAIGVTIHGTNKTVRVASYTDVAGALRARTPGSQENSSTTAVMAPVAFSHQAGGTQTTLGYDPSSGTAPTLNKSQTAAIAFSAKDHGADAGDIAPTLRAGGHANSHANAGVMPAVAFDLAQITSKTNRATVKEGHPASTLNAAGQMHMASSMQVRRLTPRECERLQGFPDDYTLVQHRGKPAADGPRYKALGNSMAVPCMRWIGERIDFVESVSPLTDGRHS